MYKYSLFTISSDNENFDYYFSDYESAKNQLIMFVNLMILLKYYLN